MYLLGDTNVVSSRVQRELAAYGTVQRVPGRDAYEISVAFAGFRDAGLNQGRWIGFSARDFGWGLAEAGHNFTFVSPEDWQLAVTGSLLSHMGKHGPMLLLAPGGLSEATTRYLEMVRPTGRLAGRPAHQPRLDPRRHLADQLGDAGRRRRAARGARWGLIARRHTVAKTPADEVECEGAVRPPCAHGAGSHLGSRLDHQLV
jgi:hypothetical protein